MPRSRARSRCPMCARDWRMSARSRLRAHRKRSRNATPNGSSASARLRNEPVSNLNNPPGRSVVRIFSSVLVLLLLPSGAWAADASTWPEKPVRIVVAAGPGAGDDFVTRLLAQKLAEITKQQFIVDNRPGAGGVIG